MKKTEMLRLTPKNANRLGGLGTLGLLLLVSSVPFGCAVAGVEAGDENGDRSSGGSSSGGSLGSGGSGVGSKSGGGGSGGGLIGSSGGGSSSGGGVTRPTMRTSPLRRDVTCTATIPEQRRPC